MPTDRRNFLKRVASVAVAVPALRWAWTFTPEDMRYDLAREGLKRVYFAEHYGSGWKMIGTRTVS